MHPWEDFAETWAHYLHIVDTLEMAAEFGLEVHPVRDQEGGLAAQIDFDPYVVESFDRISRAWLPFVFAMNSVKPRDGNARSLSFLAVSGRPDQARFHPSDGPKYSAGRPGKWDCFRMRRLFATIRKCSLSNLLRGTDLPR
jgi:hypothetical protein